MIKLWVLGGNMGQKHWGRLFLSIGALSLFQIGSVVIAGDWRPTSKSYQFREAREECSVYQSVHSTTKEQLERRINDLNVVKAATQEYFKQLSDCQHQNGILAPETNEGQNQSAQLCSESYDMWLLEGTHLITLEEEIRNLKEEIMTLRGAVSRKCLRTVVAKR